MITCNKCKSYIDSDFKFCTKCGNRLLNIKKENSQEKIAKPISTAQIENNTTDSPSENNVSGVASIMQILGAIIIICGFIAGIGFGQSNSYYDFDIATASIWWVGGFACGMLFCALGEIIILLQKIYDKLQ